MTTAILSLKFNRYFSTAQQSLVQEKENKQVIPSASGPVPLFSAKNPNSPIILSSVITEVKDKSNHLALALAQKSASAKLPPVDKTNSSNKIFIETHKGLNLALNNLVFLKKKGSHTPNPNLISYKFPGESWPQLMQPNCKLESQAGNPQLSASASAAQQSLIVENIGLRQPDSSWTVTGAVKGNVYKLLSHFFKSMYCLISKPVFIETPDNIKIQLFYFLCLPKILTSKNMLQRSVPQTKTDAKLKTGNPQQSSLFNGSNFSPAKSTELSLDYSTNNNSETSLNLSIHNFTNSDNDASQFRAKTNKKFIYLMHQLKNFNSKNINVKFNLNKLSQPSGIDNGAGHLTNVYPKKFKLICNILSKLFNKSVELELIRLHQPYYDSNILVNFLALIINKKNIGAAIQRLYNSNIINYGKAPAGGLLYSPSQRLEPFSANLALALNTTNTGAYLSGLNIKISGRLMREPIIPRVTSKKFEKGFTAKGKINYSDVARFTHKNRKGAFTITVKSGHKFF